ncbi:hypothetical protein Hanom_Chr15g01406151 [Helianthus anomalus]
MGMVRIRHFEFVCKSQGLEPSVAWPCRAVTSTGKEIVYLSSEESVGSSDHDLRSWNYVFAGVLRDLGSTLRRRRSKKLLPRRRLLLLGERLVKKVGPPVQHLKLFPKKPQSSAAVVARSSGSAGSRGPDSGATLSSVHGEEETKAEVEAEKLIRKRPRVETTATTPPVEKAATSRPIGKKGSLRKTIVKKPEIEAMKPEVEAKKLEAIIPPKTFTIEGKTVEIERPIEKEVGPEVVKITGLDYPVIMRKEPQVQIENPTTQHDASVQTEKVQTVAGGSACDAQAQVTLKLTP